MADLNKVMLIGRLTRDPQLRYLPSQTAVCEFGLATGRKYRTQSGEEREESTFVDCQLMGKGGEIFHQYCRKGKLVFLEGRLKFDSWEDKQSGQKRSKLSVMVENFQFLGGRDDAGGAGGAGAGPREHDDHYDPGPDTRGQGYASGGASSQGGGYSSAPRGPASGAGPQRGAARPPANNPPAPISDEQHFREDEVPF